MNTVRSSIVLVGTESRSHFAATIGASPLLVLPADFIPPVVKAWPSRAAVRCFRMFGIDPHSANLYLQALFGANRCGVLYEPAACYVCMTCRSHKRSDSELCRGLASCVRHGRHNSPFNDWPQVLACLNRGHSDCALVGGAVLTAPACSAIPSWRDLARGKRSPKLRC